MKYFSKLINVIIATVLCISVGPRPKRLETRVIIKISNHPVYHTDLDWFSWKWSKKKLFFWRKKFKMANFQNGRFSKLPIFKKFSQKFLQIGPWVSRIDWCEGHWFGSTCVAVRLSDIRPKTGEKRIFGVF